MTIPLFHVDAFTQHPFAGNPAAVCLLSGPASDSWMQRIAAEMNLSETAFIWPEEGAFRLRWFTPTTEVDLCGHATLAAAHIFWEEGLLEAACALRFQTRSGLLSAARKEEGWIELDFPAEPAIPTVAPPDLLEALGVPARTVLNNRFDYLVELDSEKRVREMTPDFHRLETIPVRGVVVTSRASSPYDFISRFFGPRVGINEDPVTGSAHCALGPFWRERLGKNRLLAYQASARGGVVRVHMDADRVFLGGQAVTIQKGELRVQVE